MYNIVRVLNHINRCALFPVLKPTSVAEHSYHVAVTAMCIAEELSMVTEVDKFKVVSRALLHDVEEAVVSDIPWNVKKALRGVIDLDADLKNYIEDGLTNGRGPALMPLPRWFITASSEGCDGSLEWLIVKAADLIELIDYCREEQALGNLRVSPMVANATKALEGIQNSIFNKCECVPTVIVYALRVPEPVESLERGEK